jgi:hypothetical protein
MQKQNMREYLASKGIKIVKDLGKEIVIHCLFNGCDKDSVGTEGHLYIQAETGQYNCKKCGVSGNLITLRKHFGDDVLNRPNTGKVYMRDDKKQSANAISVWETAGETPADFPYLKKKGIRSHGIRFSENRLVVPLYTSDGSLSSVQFITADGDKRFLTGAITARCFFLIGTPTKCLCIVEGFATGASVFEATGYAVAIAFSANNLKATAEEMRKQFPKVEIIICSDIDDSGLKQAREAAIIGARLAIPKFEDSEMIDKKAPTDFNDLSVLRGSLAVKTSIESAEIVREKFGFTSLTALLNEPDEKVGWIVERLLPSSGFSIIAAKPKVGKSTLARQLALCVAHGEPFLGRQTLKGSVLYVALEEKRSEVRDHFRLLGATGMEEDLGVYIGSAPEEANQWLTREVKNKKPILVIVDTLFRFARVNDVNDYAKVLAALDPLLALARDNSAHLMVIHHARKGGGDGGDSTLGSTAIFGSVDTSIILKKTEGKRTIETQQRYGTELEPTLLVFDEASKSVMLGGTREEDDLQRISDEIVAFLKTQKESVGEPTIDEEVKGRTDLKRKALRDLVAKNEISRTGAGKRGDPFLYFYSLVPTIYQGREKQETKSVENPAFSSLISCSQNVDVKTVDML